MTMEVATVKELTYQERIEKIRATKMRHTEEKWKVIGSIDMDDLPIILPPPESQRPVEVISGSGVPMTDILFKEFIPKSNHPSGGFFGARACGRNFKALLEMHPTYINPVSSLAGGYMVNFLSYRDPAWNPDFHHTQFAEEQERYRSHNGIGAVQHFCQDMTIGFELGWEGILEKIHKYRKVNTDDEAQELYDGLEAVVLGLQNWIGRNARAARGMAKHEEHPQLRQNLLEMADIN